MKRVIRASVMAADDAQNEQSSDGFGQLLEKLQQIGNYQSFISTLKGLNDNQKKLFMEYFGQVDTVKPQVSDGGINATDLIPTQSEIDWKKSLSYGLSGDCSHFFQSPVQLGPNPVLTYAGKYIIDGHHRWSQVYMFNPSAQVAVTDFNYSADGPIDVLKDFQAGVLAELGEIKVGTAGTNIWDVDEGTLTKFIEDNMSDACWNSLVKAGVCEDKASAVEYLVGNALELQSKVKPISGAPDRVDMPQTNKDVINRLKSGLSDMSAATELTCPVCRNKGTLVNTVNSATVIDGDVLRCSSCSSVIAASSVNGRLKLEDAFADSKIDVWR